MSGRERSAALKDRMAYETARIMVDQGLADFDRARRKAAERTGIRDRRHWPSNEAVRDAVLAQRRLFRAESLAGDSRALLEQAMHAMRQLAEFSPCLTGPALSGIADRETGIELFLFADRPEDVLFSLVQQKIPWKEAERSFRYPGGQRCAHPVFRFVAGEIPFDLIVLPMRARRHPPLDPVTDRPSRGADVDELAQLIAEEADYRFEMGR